MKIPGTEVQEIKTTHNVFLTKDDILEMLRHETSIPANATVTIEVPGGGDWSNTTLDIDNGEQAIRVRWTSHRTVKGPNES